MLCCKFQVYLYKYKSLRYNIILYFSRINETKKEPSIHRGIYIFLINLDYSIHFYLKTHNNFNRKQYSYTLYTNAQARYTRQRLLYMYMYEDVWSMIFNDANDNDINDSRKAAAERFSNTRCTRTLVNFLSQRSVTDRMRFINALAKFAHDSVISLNERPCAREPTFNWDVGKDRCERGFPRRAVVARLEIYSITQVEIKCRRKIRKSVSLLNRPGPSGNSWKIYVTPIYSSVWRGTRAITWNALISLASATGQLMLFFVPLTQARVKL